MNKKLGMVAASGGVIGMVMLASTPLFVNAQTSDSNLNFFERFASKLGVSEEKLTTTAKEVQYEIVDEKLASGKIDADRAAEIKQRIEESENIMLMGMGFGHGGRGMGPGKNPELLATFLGVSADEIKTLRDEGLEIDEILQKYNKTHEDFRAYMDENMPFEGPQIQFLADFLGVNVIDVEKLKTDGLNTKQVLEKYGKTLEEFRAYMWENRPEDRGRGMGFMMRDRD